MKKFLINLFLILTLNQVSFADNHISSLTWVKLQLRTYPELYWLADQNVNFTNEGTSNKSDSWSQSLFGTHYPEFERTLLSIAVLEMLKNGRQSDYLLLIRAQNPTNKLSFQNFISLRKRFIKILQNEQKIELVKINLVIGDLGKTLEARKRAHNISHLTLEEDQDHFLSQCLSQNLDIFPSLRKHSKKEKLLLNDLHASFHLGHLTHIEGGVNTFTGPIPRNFDIELLTQICDVAAARGHQTNKGSLVLDNKTYQVLNLLLSTLKKVNPKEGDTALIFYINARAKWLGFDDDMPNKNVLTRLSCMLRLTEPHEGDLLKKAWSQISPNLQKEIAYKFDPFKNWPVNTPTYIPAVLINVFEAQKHNPEKAFKFILEYTLPFILRTIYTYTRSPNYNSNLTICFNSIAGLVKKNPFILKDLLIADVDESGNVIIKNKYQ